MRNMKMNKRQGIVVLLLVALVAFSSATGIARTLDEFVRLATFEAFPEIRQAAAIALVPLWVESGENDESLMKSVFVKTGYLYFYDKIHT